MDLISGYNSNSDASESDNDKVSPPSSTSATTSIPLIPTASTILRMNAAPTPSLTSLYKAKMTSSGLSNSNQLIIHSSNTSNTSTTNNINQIAKQNPNSKYSTKSTALQNAPLQGPSYETTTHNFKQKSWSSGANIGAAGVYEKVDFDSTTFDLQFNEYKSKGTCETSDGKFIDVNKITPKLTLGKNSDNVKVESSRYLPVQSGDGEGKKSKKKAKKRSYEIDSDDETIDISASHGIWDAPSKRELRVLDEAQTDAARGELTDFQLERREELEEQKRKKGKKSEDSEETSIDRMVERKLAHLLPPRLAADAEPKVATSTFHGGQLRDYQGRSWLAIPSECRITNALDLESKAYIPTKTIHTFKGHTKGVHCIRFFPKSGHFLLSAGLDGLIKLWSMYGNRKCMRTYDGHTAGVRDICFNASGSKFLSASFDRYVRLWDTETGECLKTFCNRRVPYCLQFYPNDENFFVVGCSDNKAITYNIETGEITQEYYHHLAAINSITFVENGKKMITTSDDKKILIWEWDIGVPIKYIADPTMHSIPTIAVHPNLETFAAQSLDNEIKVYEAKDKFHLQKKKKFTGHQVAGYACQISFSPNGQFISSGDGSGALYFWDWSSGRNYKRMDHAHKGGPAMGVVWHPIEPSWCASCGWDGVIKLWGGDRES